MGIRYNNRSVITNEEEAYQELMEDHGQKKIIHYSSPTMNYLTPEQRRGLINEKYIWNVGDRYWKLASQYYKDPSLWWLIAWYNRKPTESFLRLGDPVIIPLPLERVLKLYYASRAL